VWTGVEVLAEPARRVARLSHEVLCKRVSIRLVLAASDTGLDVHASAAAAARHPQVMKIAAREQLGAARAADWSVHEPVLCECTTVADEGECLWQRPQRGAALEEVLVVLEE